MNQAYESAWKMFVFFFRQGVAYETKLILHRIIIYWSTAE